MGRPRSTSPEGAEVEGMEEQAPKKHPVTVPWKPARILDAPVRKGFVRRWVTTSRIGNIDKKKSEGWDFVRDDSGEKIARTIEDGRANVDGSIKCRELVLMELPMERKLARDEWLRNRTPTPQRMTQEFREDIAKAAGEQGHSYGEVTTTGG